MSRFLIACLILSFIATFLCCCCCSESMCEMAEELLTTQIKKPKKTARGLADVKLLHDDNTDTCVHPPADVYSSRVNVFRQQHNEMNEKWVKFINSDQPVVVEDKVHMRDKAEEDLPQKKPAVKVGHADYVEETLSLPPTPPPCLYVKTKNIKTKKLHDILRNVDKLTDSHLKRLDIEAGKGVSSKVDSCDFDLANGELGNDDVDVICVDDEWSSSRIMKVKINVLTKGTVLQYDMQMKDQFQDVIKDLARQCEIDPIRSMLLFGDKTVKQTDTPTSIGLNYCDILDFGILPDSDSVTLLPSCITSKIDRNVITLKLQSRNSRAKVEMSIKKSEPIYKLMKEYSIKYDKDITKLVFKFDGDVLDAESTVEELELEDGFCLDVMER